MLLCPPLVLITRSLAHQGYDHYASYGGTCLMLPMAVQGEWQVKQDTCVQLPA